MPSMMNMRKGIYTRKRSGNAFPARFKALAISDTAGWWRCEDDPKLGGPGGWVNIAGTPFSSVIGIAYSGPLRRFIVANYAANQIAYSDDDNVTFTTIAVPFAAYYLKFVAMHNLFYALTSTGAVYTSPDGITWTAKTALGFVANSMGFSPTLGSGDGRIVAVGGASAKYSDDKGVTWTAVTTTASNAVGCDWSAKNGLFNIGSRGTNGLLYSLDGITWVIGVGPASYNYIATNERTGFAHAGPHQAGTFGARSTDGKVWSAGNMPAGLAVTTQWLGDRGVFYAGYFGAGTFWAPDDNSSGWTSSIPNVANWYALGHTDQTLNPD